MFAAQQNYFNLYVVGELSVSSSASALGIETCHTCLFFSFFFFFFDTKQMYQAAVRTGLFGAR